MTPRPASAVLPRAEYTGGVLRNAALESVSSCRAVSDCTAVTPSIASTASTLLAGIVAAIPP